MKGKENREWTMRSFSNNAYSYKEGKIFIYIYFNYQILMMHQEEFLKIQQKFSLKKGK
jgi:hypothetical protein